MGILELIFAGGMVAVMLMVIAFVYIRDTEVSTRLRSFEKSIEDINLQMYKLKKSLKEKEFEDNDGDNEFRIRLRNEVKSENEILKAELYEAMKDFGKEYEEERIRLEDKIAIIEERLKESFNVSTVTTSVDETRIIALFQKGYGVDAIAKELNIGKGEVELSLSLANLR